MAIPATKSKSTLDFEESEEQVGSRRIRSREFLRLLRYLFAHPSLVSLGFLLVLVATAAALLQPRLFGFTIDQAIIPRDEAKLTHLVFLFFGIECIRLLAVIGQGYCFTMLGQRVMQALRLDLLNHLQRLPVSVFDRTPAGKLVTRITNDISSLAEMFSSGMVTIVTNFLTVGGILIWLLLLDVQLALISMAIFPVLVGFSVYFSQQLRMSYREARNRLSSLNAFLAENIMGMRVVQLFVREVRQMDRFKRVNESYTRAQIGTVRVFAFFQPSITWASGIAMASVVLAGGTRAYRGEIPVGVLVSFFAYVMAAFQPVREIADKWNVFLSGMASAERIFSILEWPVEEGVSSDLKPVKRDRLSSIQGEIQFDNVWFAYSSENWILKGVSFRISAGSSVGVVGHSGAGKSTLIGLLLRFYEPNRGRILIDGVDIREYGRRELRARVGFIQQDVFLFSGSIQENISLFRDLPEEQISLPEGLSDRELFERGVNLSVGERQRVSFLRAQANCPDIWILDEATSNVDSSTEREITALLKKNGEGKTQILVAHRLSTIREADLILVLHRGELIESGKHHELILNQGLYSRMVDLQRIQDQVFGSENGSSQKV